MLGALIGFFTALPELIKLAGQFMGWINKISGNDPQGFVRQVGEAMGKLNAAQTEQERIDAAKAIAQAISGIR